MHNHTLKGGGETAEEVNAALLLGYGTTGPTTITSSMYSTGIHIVSLK